MINDYKALKNVLESIFSVNVGLSEDEEDSMFDNVLQNKEYREQLCAELDAALSDPSLSWTQLLENDRYEVYSADSEEDAKSYVLDLFWDKLFFDQKRPD